MKKTYLFLLSILIFQINSFAQPNIQWQKYFGGSGFDYASSIQQTSDNGYIVVGSSSSNNGDVTGNHGSADFWIVKLDSNGILQWQKSLGGTSSENAYSIQQTFDGGYIVVGESSSNDGDVTGNHSTMGRSDYWVVKLNSTGTIEWQKTLGGSTYENHPSIRQTIDSGYIVAGLTYSNDGDVTGNHGASDYWIVKLNGTGTIEWQKCLGGTSYDQAYSIQQTKEGGYIVAELAVSNDSDVSGNHSYDYWIVKLYSNGSIQWQKCFGGTGVDVPYSIQQTTDSGYIIAGESYSNDGDITGHHGTTNYNCCGADMWIVKLNSTGTLQWQKSLGGTSNEGGESGYYERFSIQQTSDSGFIAAGWTISNDGDVTGNHSPIYNGDMWVVKLNRIGTIQWQKCLGGSAKDEAYSIKQTTDGGYIVAGESYSNDGDVTGNHGNADFWIVKLSSVVGIEDLFANENSFIIYPNPLISSSVIQFKSELINAEVIIYDMLGKVMMSKKLTGNKMKIEKGSLESGIYFVTVRNNERQYTRKIVVE